MTLSVYELAFRAKISHRAVEVVVRDVRRDGDLSKRRGACQRRVRWNVRQSRRGPRGGRRGKTVLRNQRSLTLLVIPRLLPALVTLVQQCGRTLGAGRDPHRSHVFWSSPRSTFLKGSTRRDFKDVFMDRCFPGTWCSRLEVHSSCCRGRFSTFQTHQTGEGPQVLFIDEGGRAHVQMTIDVCGRTWSTCR